MKIEQNEFMLQIASGQTGYVDLARCLSALNGKMIAQTKRHDGKYKPLGFLVRVRAIVGNTGVYSLNCGYPTRNAVVLAGASRDAMLKSAGVSRSNLESYQKELRLLFDEDMKDTTTFAPFATAIGMGPDFALQSSHVDSYGNTNTYDYTQIVFDDPDNPGTDVTQTLCVLGGKPSGAIANETVAPVVYNWSQWRHNFTPSDAKDDIADNVFSYTMQQSSTADKIIDIVEDEADEKPYDLQDFTTKPVGTAVGTGVGSPISQLFCAPLGLMKLTGGVLAEGSNSVLITVEGVTEL